MEAVDTYWGTADDGWIVGFLNIYPELLTQGKTLTEMEEMLADVYRIRPEEGRQLALYGK